MNAPLATHSAGTADFVFRAADRMRIEGCTNAIAREGLSLSLQSEHEALLDHYLGLLLKRLRQESPEHSIEVYFPSNTDALLTRFNEALARQSVDEATRSPAQASRAQIWIVHDAQALPEAEIQLLARLIQNFPGANIRAILLMNSANAPSQLSAFGRKILRWDIEAPSAEQAQATLDIARAEGYLLPVQQLLKRIQRQSLYEDADALAVDAAHFADPAPAEPDTTANGPARTQQVKQHVLAMHEKGQQALQQSAWLLGHWRRSHTLVALGIGAALVLSTLTMLWLQPEAFGIDPVTSATAPMPLPIEWPEPTSASAADPALPAGPAQTPAPVPAAAPNPSR